MRNCTITLMLQIHYHPYEGKRGTEKEREREGERENGREGGGERERETSIDSIDY